MPSTGKPTDPAHAICSILLNHASLSDEEADAVAHAIVDTLGLKTHYISVEGTEYLGGVNGFQWVSDCWKL